MKNLMLEELKEQTMLLRQMVSIMELWFRDDVRQHEQRMDAINKGGPDKHVM